jgi:hypothetical protein
MFPDFIPEQLLWALGLSAAVLALATHAHADLSVSRAATQNVSCQQVLCRVIELDRQKL